METVLWVAWAAHRQGQGPGEGPLALGQYQTKQCGWSPRGGDSDGVLKYEDQAGIRPCLCHDVEALLWLVALLPLVTIASIFCV